MLTTPRYGGGDARVVCSRAPVGVHTSLTATVSGLSRLVERYCNGLLSKIRGRNFYSGVPMSSYGVIFSAVEQGRKYS